MSSSELRMSGNTCAVELPTALAEYAERVLLSTGLSALDALLIASGEQDPPLELAGIARALRAGWDVAQDAR